MMNSSSWVCHFLIRDQAGSLTSETFSITRTLLLISFVFTSRQKLAVLHSLSLTLSFLHLLDPHSSAQSYTLQFRNATLWHLPR